MTCDIRSNHFWISNINYDNKNEQCPLYSTLCTQCQLHSIICTQRQLYITLCTQCQIYSCTQRSLKTMSSKYILPIILLVVVSEEDRFIWSAMATTAILNEVDTKHIKDKRTKEHCHGEDVMERLICNQSGQANNSCLFAIQHH